MVYGWTNGSRFPAEADAIGERIEQLRHEHGGMVMPEHVVADARSTASPLHCCFQWDDAKAADAYRLDQARLVLRSLTVVVDERSPRPVRAFVAVASTVGAEDGESNARAYTSIGEALNDPLLREQILDSAYRELRSWRARYAQLQELARLFSVVDEQLELNETVVK